MKKIFHFVKSNYLTGVENVIINICTLVKGYDYTFVSIKGPIDKYLKYYGIKHIVIPNLKPLTILRVIKKYNPNIVQAHDEYMTVMMSFSYFYCHKHHIKMISELQNEDPKFINWWEPRSLAYLFSSYFYNNIICVSPNIIKDYVYGKLIRNKIDIIPNIINPYRIKKGLLSDARKKWDCLFLGRIVYQKNPLRFIRIMYKLKRLKNNLKIIVIGNGSLMNVMKDLAHKYNLDDNINFVGFKSNPYKYIQESKVSVITSRFEGFCLVALESIMIGTPVVSTPLDVLKELIGKRAGNFAKNDNEFVHQIFNLINKRTLYNYKKHMGLKRIILINDVNQFIKEYKLVYNE